MAEWYTPIDSPSPPSIPTKRCVSLVYRLADQSKALVLALHDLCLTMRVADEVAVLFDGYILQSGIPKAIYASGILNAVFQITLQCIGTESGWQYYYA